MDIEKLIERLRIESLYAEKATLEIMDLCMEAAAAIEVSQIENQALRNAANGLRAENEVLRKNLKSMREKYDELEQERAHRIHAEQHADAFLRDCERLNAELEQVKWERDAAVSDLETIMAYNSDTCQFCKNGQCYVRGGTKSCLPKWRGQKEE